MLVYKVKDKNKEFIVINERKQKQGFDKISNLVFSDDSKKLDYSAKLNKKWFIILEEDKSIEFDKVYSLLYYSKEKCFLGLVQNENKVYTIKF